MIDNAIEGSVFRVPGGLIARREGLTGCTGSPFVEELGQRLAAGKRVVNKRHGPGCCSGRANGVMGEEPRDFKVLAVD